MEMIKGKAVCNRILFSKNGFVIALFSPTKEYADKMPSSFSMKGDIYVKPKEEYKIHGQLDTKTTYSDSYDAIRVAKDIDLNKEDRKSVQIFLETATSEKRAKAIMDTLEDPISALENRDILKLSTVKGVGNAVAEKLIDSYFAHKDYSSAYIELAKYGLTVKAIKKICDNYGDPDKAIAVINENPYSLTEVDGYGFTRADSVFLSIPENKPTDKRRVRAYIEYMFEEEENSGNSWMTPQDFVSKIKEFIPNADLHYAVDYIQNSDDYVYLSDGEEKRLATKRAYNLEVNIVKELDRLMNAKSNMDLDGYEQHVGRVEKVNGWKYSDEQRSAIDGMVRNNVYMLQGLAGSGKAQPKWVEIPTPNGFKELGDIMVGDYVFDRRGNPTKVTGVFPQGMLDNYEITLGDGRKTWSNDEHLWTSYTSKGNFRTKTLREMIDMGLYHGTSGKKNTKFKIPTSEAIEFPEKEFGVDPYVLGAFLGDGACTGKYLTISSNDEYVVSEVSRLIGAKSYRRLSDKNYNWKFELRNVKIGGGYSPHNMWRYDFRTEDIFGGYPEVTQLSGDKYIPEEFFYGSIDQRLSLIQGLMDTDGHIDDSKRANVSFSSTSHKMVKGVQRLLYSLGWQSTIVVDEREGRNTAYELLINIPNEDKHLLFRLPRHRDVALKYKDVKKRRRYDRVGIADVQKLEEKEDMVCIMVDNDEHLYLTNDFIVTHNTSVVEGFTSAVSHNGYSVSQCALAGKAADNLTKVTGKQGYTIHSLLGFDFETNGFKHHANNPLPANVVVLDELSMVNAKIFYSLIRAIRTGSKLIMIGDYGQLEAIGVGIMGGMIASKKIPMTLLKKIHRQAQDSAIITHSISVRSGQTPKELELKPNSNDVYGAKEDLEYIIVRDDEEDKILNHAIIKFKESLQKFDISDIQIICSTKKTGKTSTYDLNRLAQMVFNPDKDVPFIELGYKDHRYQVKVGDKVINMKNNRNTFSPEGVIRPIYNGNTGIVTDIKVDEDGEHLIIDFDGIGLVNVEGDAVKNIELGYAITTHKSQGSTIKCVIFALPFHYLLNTRELVYTGMTRASDYQIIITSPRSFKRAIKTTTVSKKKTHIKKIFEDKENTDV